jgi:hypothetical protein
MLAAQIVQIAAFAILRALPGKHSRAGAVPPQPGKLARHASARSMTVPAMR